VAELAVDAQLQVVQVGSTVRLRSGRAPGERRSATSLRLGGAGVDGDQEVTIVASDADVGLYRLSPRAPLAAALLGRQVGDVVEVVLEQVRAAFLVTAVNTPNVVPAEPERGRGDGIVRLGSLVRVRGGDLTEWWRIVAAHEADALRRLISEETPLARALLGRQVGDQVRTEAPGGRWLVTILGVDSEGIWA
jgi:transcription elongation GreA/GreB family factor